MTPRVDVFWTDLDAAAAMLPACVALLDEDETAQADRFRYALDRERYIGRHAMLRLLLARALGRAPQALSFTASTFGKPALSDGACAFNLSHSRGLALFAISRDVPVGCDIEFHDARFLAEDIPESFFSSAELSEWRALPTESRLAAFFDGWTRKEAYIKARGRGLSLPLDSFDVSLLPGDRPSLHRYCGDWTARTVAPTTRCSAAIVAAGNDWAMRAQPIDAQRLFVYQPALGAQVKTCVKLPAIS